MRDFAPLTSPSAVGFMEGAHPGFSVALQPRALLTPPSSHLYHVPPSGWTTSPLSQVLSTTFENSPCLACCRPGDTLVTESAPGTLCRKSGSKSQGAGPQGVVHKAGAQDLHGRIPRPLDTGTTGRGGPGQRGLIGRVPGNLCPVMWLHRCCCFTFISA